VEKVSIVDYIKNLPFFEEFTDSEKSSILGKKALLEEYQLGETILEEGATESWLYVVLKGKVGLYKSIHDNVDDGRISLKDSEEILVKEIDIGSIFGEISLITDRPRNVTARAASTDVSVIKITKEILESFDQSIQMKIQKQLLTQLAENLDNMNTESIKLKLIIKKKLNLKV
jgi:CRP/FNR family transcriptional regulator, cyclic AMP receptor protein